MAGCVLRPRIASRWLGVALALGGVAAGRSPRTARAGDEAARGFPAAWFGTWKGPGTTRNSGGTGPSFVQELAIGATDAPGHYTWTIRFEGSEGRQERPYVLVAKDAAKGDFVIDEGRGIELPATFVDGTLFTHFEVGGHRITTRARVEGAGTAEERMDVETVTASAGRQTVVGGKDDVPMITGWPIGSVQSAVLRRQPAASGTAPRAPLDADLERLATLLSGTFSDEAQAKGRKGRRPIRLTMKRIATDRADGPWIRLEQAFVDAPDAPYRKLVYRLEHVGGDLFECHAYAEGGPATPAGDADPSRSLVLRRIDATTFRGAPLGVTDVVPDPAGPGALHAVTITPTGIETLEAGLRIGGALGQAFARILPGFFDLRRVDDTVAPPAPAAGATPERAPPR